MQQEAVKKYNNYGEFSRQWLKDNEIKLKTVTIEDGNYNPHFIYLNRIANGNRPKFRILTPGKDKVKNCIMVTFNVERHDRQYLCYLIQSKMRVIEQWSVGTCHRFIRQTDIAQILSGAVNARGQMNEEVLY